MENHTPSNADLARRLADLEVEFRDAMRQSEIAQQHEALVLRDLGQRLSALERPVNAAAGIDDELAQLRLIYEHEIQRVSDVWGAVEDKEAGLSQHIPAFLNALSTVGALAHQQQVLRGIVQSIQERLE